MAQVDKISINLDYIDKDLSLNLFPEGSSKLYLLEEAEAEEYGEAPYQILESQSYEYAFNKDHYSLSCDNQIIIYQSRRKTNTGRINPSFYVGTLKLNVLKNGDEKGITFLEVIATKFNSDNLDKSYRENYRFMLESITEKCTELLLQVNSPLNQFFETDFERDKVSLYQQFSFVNSIVNNQEFEEAIQKIISSPKTNWSEDEELVDVRRVKKFTRSGIKQLASRGNRILIPESHPRWTKHFDSLPNKIINVKKVEEIDNLENRFIKHCIQTYLQFSEDCQAKFDEGSRSFKEAKQLSFKLELILDQQFFKQISRPANLNLNSPVLQRKSGYREVLKSWLKFDLAAKLTWKGGEDVYEAGKRDISKLYEYWLFFMLYDMLKDKFNLETIEHEDVPYSSLIEQSQNKLNFIIKSGKYTALSGLSVFANRKLNVKFSYNKTFEGDKDYKEGVQGSYTKTMFPDYTLSFWPEGITEKQAEKLEQIVHIHFDAKYKVNYSGNFTESRAKEEEEERSGTYKNIDLFKMHAYKDAIRRTGGAYILYPGNSSMDSARGFHEIIPGLGAFAIRPSREESGIEKLKNFIDEIVLHLLDRSSQRENIASKVFAIHQRHKMDNDVLRKKLPEFINNRRLIPDETQVLIGYCRGQDHLSWIDSKRKYNIRFGDNYKITSHHIEASYLLLYTEGKGAKCILRKLNTLGPNFVSAEKLADKNDLDYYKEPTAKLYLVYDIDGEIEDEFKEQEFDLTKVIPKNWDKKPFTKSLTDFIKLTSI